MINTYVKNIMSMGVKPLSREEEKTATVEQLVESNLMYVIRVSHKYTNKGMSLNDLVQEGNIGLIEAAEKFDPSKNCKFITYADWYIKMRIKRALTATNNPVTVSDAHTEKVNKIRKYVAKYKEENGDEPSVKQIAKATKYSVKAVNSCYKHKINGQFSLNKPVKADSGKASMDEIITDGEYMESPVDTLNKKDMKVYLSKLMDSLTENEAQVIKMRFFDNLTLDKTGQNLNGISPAGVKAIQDRALGKLKNLINI